MVTVRPWFLFDQLLILGNEILYLALRATKASTRRGRKKKIALHAPSRFQQVKHARFACNSTSYTNILHLTSWSALVLVHCRHEILLLCCGVWFVRFYLCVILSVCFCSRKIPTLGYLRREPGESWSRCSGSSEGSGYNASGMMMLTCMLFCL